ncbi:glycosyltransferase family 1 protein [Gordonia sp. PKS22-38]|uniref:Glycosyltransferase family 1 protein n=1 Tax=Gordonia prachuapensis TaxID=3115651 RepID=A0ABU7MYH2_9ACTN|nr:glycosyltransferase family 1 protein [Gordonia sp. PKS22-38]
MDRAGLETMLMNYYRHIDRTKIQFDFLMHREEPSSYDAEILSLGGQIYRISPITPRNLATYKRRYEHFFRTHTGYRVAHAHMDALSAFPLSAAKHSKVPVRIAHSHNTGFSPDIKLPIRLIAKRYIPRYATHLFACSNDASRFMFGPKRASRIVENAIEIEKFKYDDRNRKEVRKRHGISDSSFVIGHVGRFVHQKNQEFLVEVLNQLKNKDPRLELILIGSGENEARVRNRVVSSGLQQRVHFVGESNEVPAYMHAMDMLALPSRYEGLGMVAVEAQASGLPCILSTNVTRDANVSGAAEFLDLESTLWARRILELRADTRKSWANQVRDAGYDIRDQAQKLETLYRDLHEIAQR